jgi:hypothetical protein
MKRQAAGANVFALWAALARQLHNACLEEFASLITDVDTGELLGSIAGIVSGCDKLARLVDRMEPGARQALNRALAKVE